MILSENWVLTARTPQGELGPLAARVPGCAHTDLERAGVLKNLFWRDNLLRAGWVERSVFTYTCRFDCPGELPDTLTFEGVDTVADITLNGVRLGRTQNMHIAWRFDVGGIARARENVLEVRFVPLAELEKNWEAGRYTGCFAPERVWLRRTQCTFGWDWVPRIVSFGLFLPVRLERRPAAGVSQLYAYVRELESGAAVLHCEARVRGVPQGTPVRFEVTAPGAAGPAASAEVPAGAPEPGEPNPTGGPAGGRPNPAALPEGAGARVCAGLTVKHPRLWWPAGSGEQPLYTLRVSVPGASGETLFGIRTVRVEELPDRAGAGRNKGGKDGEPIGSSYTVVVNGRRIFARGGNWVPCSPFPSEETPERLEERLRLLPAGNMNMLRVWGGGSYESDAFWQLCDRLGILVSLDFMMACAQYPEDRPWFMAQLAAETRYNVLRLRSHPSLIFYNGNNEIAMNQSDDVEYDGRRASEEVTEPLVRALDPSRSYFPTSPYRGRPFNAPYAGDCHSSVWYDPAYIQHTGMRDYRARIAAVRTRFLSECAVPGTPQMTALRRMMTPHDIAGDGRMWEVHTNDNPYKGDTGITHYGMLRQTAEKLFGPFEGTADKIHKMSLVQYEFARLEAANSRSRKYDSSGILFWMYDDCWPASGWAMVDYWGRPKAGYYGAKQAFAPLLVWVEGRAKTLRLHLVNDTFRREKLTLQCLCTTAEGRVLWRGERPVTLPANAAAAPVDIPRAEACLDGEKDRVFAARLLSADGLCVSRDVYTDCTWGELQLPPAALRVRVRALNETAFELTVSSGVFAKGVMLEGDYSLEDNYFDLLPGESRTVVGTRLGGAPLPAPGAVRCLNRG